MKKNIDLNSILLIDDDKISNFIHQKIIKRANIDVQVMINDNGKDAINYLKNIDSFSDEHSNISPSIIFLDINMPGMSGWDFITEYRQLTYTQKDQTIIAMLTTSGNPDDKLIANKTPEISLFLKKPLTLKKLKKAIRTYFSSVNKD